MNLPQVLKSAKDFLRCSRAVGVCLLRYFGLMSSPKDSPKMTKQNASFGEVLRAVGQGLESLDVENFELEVEGDGYLALGTPREPSPGALESGSMQPGVKNTRQDA